LNVKVVGASRNQ